MDIHAFILLAASCSTFPEYEAWHIKRVFLATNSSSRLSIPSKRTLDPLKNAKLPALGIIDGGLYPIGGIHPSPMKITITMNQKKNPH